MAVLPRALENLIEQFSALPGVGPRTAERYALGIWRKSDNDARRLAAAIDKLHTGIRICPVTFALINSDQDVSPLYTSPERDKQVIAIVEDAIDIVALEKTTQFNGTYHVLGGLISPIDGVSPEQLHLSELAARIKKDAVQELILALNASVEGESTALYIQKMLADDKLDVTVTRLARGLPVGLDLEYADQVTLSRALEHRTQL